MVESKNTKAQKIIFGTMLLLFITLHIGGQNNLSLNVMCERDKLPISSIKKVIQDNDGFLWFGTPNGLARYDAYRTLIFRSDVDNPTLLSSNDIVSLVADNNANILLGTSKGVDILNRVTFEVKHLEHEDVSGKYIRSILAASDGTIWVGTTEKLLRFSKNLELINCYSKKVSQDNTTVPLAGVNYLYEDKQGNVWILIHDNGIFKYNAADNTFTSFPKVGTNNNPFKIYQDKDNDYWVATWGSGVYSFDPQTGEYIKFHLYNKTEEEQIVFGVVQDDNLDRIWLIGSLGIYAVKKTEDGRIEQLEIGDLLKKSNNIFTDIQKLDDGNLCIATDGDGVLSLDFDRQEIGNFPLNKIKQQYGIGTDILAMYKCRDNSYVIAQNRLGLCFADSNFLQIRSFEEYPALRGITDIKHVNCIQGERETDRVWVGLEHSGAVYVIAVKDQKVTLEEKFNLPTIFEKSGNPRIFFEDSKGNMWIVTDYHILCKLKGGELVKVTTSPLRGLTDITEDTLGQIWLTSDSNGIYKIEQKRKNSATLAFSIQNYTVASHQLVSDRLMAICADEHNGLWYSTAEGYFVQWNHTDNTYNDFTNLCGAKGEVIQNIVIDRQENLWISTCNRIIQYKPQLSALRVYSAADNLIVNMFHRGSVYNDKATNRMLYGGYHGICSFEEKDFWYRRLGRCII